MNTGPDAPRVLCIAGSPRRFGNSERLLDALIQGVKDAGGVPVKLVAVDADVHYCLGCNSCSKEGRCTRRDGMDEVRALIDSADAIAVATPIFFATVPAVLKTLLDRCQPYWVRRYLLKEPRPTSNRPGAVLIVGGGGDPFGSDCALTPVKSVFAVLSVSVEHIIEVIGPDKLGDVAGEPDVLEGARVVGVSLVEAARAQS